ncbi:ODV-E27 [Perigonia lusca single nucleopolyhedrovirus]|uniref:ODV-E27 n=1 Tax=Perigonia lusca single nucleopolyhedrovirus TaxID=1675865 RepID=A0A0M3WND2_9ABAC|nr:ODV-E27 [Perigonia lusca single nucleopolyhedrovirus]AKN80555.1 ODV-E27 [Perigonia lusca single nucleopolyhedrovirus]
MKKLKCHSQPAKIRTVTEIINSQQKLSKTYDMAEFDAKNLNSLESYNSLKIKLVVAKYMAMLNTLKLTQPLLTIFRDKTAQREIVTIILASLGFVHNRVNPLVNNFDNRIEFIIIESKEDIFPGEPIVFRENENDDIVCIIDRISIVRMLERHFDTNMCMDSMMEQEKKLQMMKAFSSSGIKRRRNNHGDDDFDKTEAPMYDIQLSETECTRYLIMLLIVEHAYCHYVIFKNHGPNNYFESLVNHMLFTRICKSTLNMSFDNLLLSKFKFHLEECDSKKLSCGILNL